MGSLRAPSRRSCTRATSESHSCAGPISSRPVCSRCRPSLAGGTSSTRSCTAPRRRCPGASRSTVRIGSLLPVRPGIPGVHPVSSAVPVRVRVRGARRVVPRLAGVPCPPLAEAGRPAARVLRVVRRGPFCPRVASPGELDILRDPDRPDRVLAVRHPGAADPRLATPPGTSARRSTEPTRARDLGRRRATGRAGAGRRGSGRRDVRTGGRRGPDDAAGRAGGPAESRRQASPRPNREPTRNPAPSRSPASSDEPDPTPGPAPA